MLSGKPINQEENIKAAEVQLNVEAAEAQKVAETKQEAVKQATQNAATQTVAAPNAPAVTAVIAEVKSPTLKRNSPAQLRKLSDEQVLKLNAQIAAKTKGKFPAGLTSAIGKWMGYTQPSLIPSEQVSADKKLSADEQLKKSKLAQDLADATVTLESVAGEVKKEELAAYITAKRSERDSRIEQFLPGVLANGLLSPAEHARLTREQRLSDISTTTITQMLKLKQEENKLEAKSKQQHEVPKASLAKHVKIQKDANALIEANKRNVSSDEVEFNPATLKPTDRTSLIRSEGRGTGIREAQFNEDRQVKASQWSLQSPAPVMSALIKAKQDYAPIKAKKDAEEAAKKAAEAQAAAPAQTAARKP